jgi:phospholipid N-methyltransferase
MFDSKWTTFLKGALRSPTEVGTIFPSSQAVAREYTRGLDMKDDPTILELGPGTGAITEHFHRTMSQPERYLGIEQDGDYVELLRQQCPEMHFVQGSAADMIEHVDATGLGDLDLVASGLPFATLPEDVLARIYDGLDTLVGPGTQFRAIQLAHAWPTTSARRFRRRVNRMFGPCRRSRLVWRNLPPAYVLVWEG